jgi:hypothetical protein
MLGKPNVMAIPYKNFKQKIRLSKKYLKEYKVEDLGGVLYMEKRQRS